jgi:hypothetical protein
MPHTKKKQRLEEGQSNDIVVSAADDDHDNTASSFDDLGTDELAHIFGFLAPEDIMLARLNNKMREAAKKTIVPMADFYVDSLVKYNAMAVMTTALPNLQQITLGSLGHRHKYSDGEDPDERWAARTANLNFIASDIDIISNFRKLRILRMKDAPLNGRYPFLFNFPLLQLLDIRDCSYLKWDLEMLTGLPLLTELHCHNNRGLTGNINSLRVLKDSLEKVKIYDCHVEGNFMDLADFPHLKMLNLMDTDVTGDVRDIGESDFSALEYLKLPNGVYGGTGYTFQRISDAPDVISALYPIKKIRPNLLKVKDWYGKLSEDSPDWYIRSSWDTPPLFIFFVHAGSRVGFRWETAQHNPCEVNWLDPEPAKESSDYEQYTGELHEIERQVDIYRGFTSHLLKRSTIVFWRNETAGRFEGGCFDFDYLNR